MENQLDILAVDDTVDNLKVLAAILQKKNYKVRPATSGKLALDAIYQSVPDLVILDIRMPEMDGFDVCKALREMPACSSLPVIFLSGVNEIQEKVKAFAVGGNDYISKPFNQEEVLARVGTHLKIKIYQDKIEEMIATGLVEIGHLNKELLETQSELLLRLSELCEFRSQETGLHIKRVAGFSYLFAHYLGCTNEEAELIRMAAPLHDIGKIAIPDSILLKQGKLDPEEWEIMKKHVDFGYRMLEGSSRPLIATAAKIAYEHHEKWDGTGYPRQLTGKEISDAGRVVACADVLDALASERCYKTGWEFEKIKSYFKAQSGKHFDPSLVEILINYEQEFLDIKDSLNFDHGEELTKELA